MKMLDVRSGDLRSGRVVWCVILIFDYNLDAVWTC